jgi:predicted transcriptional regulator
MKLSAAQETSQDRVIRIVQELPADCSYDEILHELAFRRMVDRGLVDAEAGRTVSNDEALRRIESWAK